MNRVTLRYLSAIFLVCALEPCLANAQGKASAPITYFLTNYQDTSHHKIMISIPADYFMDGIMPASGSTDGSFLLRVSWPSWTSDARGFDPDALRILGDVASSQESKDALARSLLVNVATANPRDEPLDRPVRVDMIPPRSGSLPIPSGHGIMQVIHNKADFLDDKDVYVLRSHLPEMTLSCDKDGVVPQCAERFDFGHLILEIGYPRRQVGHWFEIMNDVKRKFATFVKQP